MRTDFMKVVSVFVIDASFIINMIVLVVIVIIAVSLKEFLQVVTIENARGSYYNQADNSNNHE